MEKTIAWEAIIEVNGFHDAKNWIYRMVRAGIIKCGQCSNPATHVFWQDQAEWYVRCNQHPEYGEQWTGSTRWNPSSFGLYVIGEQVAKAWRDTLTPDERERVKIESFDATDYRSLFKREESGSPVYNRHYLVGSEVVDGYKVYANVYLLTNGEYAYELHRAWLYGVSGTVHGYGLKGAWATEALAVEAARAELPSVDDVAF